MAGVLDMVASVTPLGEAQLTGLAVETHFAWETTGKPAGMGGSKTAELLFVSPLAARWENKK